MNNGIRSFAAIRRGLPGSSKKRPTTSLILRIFSTLSISSSNITTTILLRIVIYKFMNSEEEYQIEVQLSAELFTNRQKFVSLIKICRYHVHHRSAIEQPDKN